MRDSNGRRRVVVTGVGVISALGHDADTFWEGLKAGKSGVTPLPLEDIDDYPCRIGATVQDYDPTDFMDRKESRRLARFAQFAVIASGEALDSAGLNRLEDLSNEDLTRCGVLLGTGIGGYPETEAAARVMVKRSGTRISPYYIPMMLPNMAAANVSRVYGATGYIGTTITACAAGTQSIGEAAEVIRRGGADVMVAGGAEAGICEIGLGGFSTIHALSTNSNETPEKASRPFDAERDGFVPAEGSGILILEDLEHALNRGAEILGEVGGWGVTSDAHHLVHPPEDGAGAVRAMQMALNDAGIQPGDVDYINAHGTSTPVNDAAETLAIKTVFGENAVKTPISSTKSMIGHSLGASGGLEAVAAIRTIRDGVIHPTVNYENPDPACDLDYVPNEAREATVNTVLSNSFGFGGQNACVVLKRYV
ncbi:MAG: beta-ketoacyl-ACP synthase II [Chloroflexi bacterium]|nr:beta-ketoacyl-ACP synthase II [Chloroflexota bacterium]MBT4072269.1 beta-ketoacyl-ACP synthase II [Chloroflexota bacterium]MBT4513925.1 beta-ketoacyl-ACP synthase II [Chloroflexota bacterium]MBT5318271.1 beta-ketoacyl-ACP synthase II [Chloroflexota bacterium]MBT6680587.1 beta-ketoacyl-ACP synthase II [Chloroflexota bacterium]